MKFVLINQNLLNKTKKNKLERDIFKAFFVYLHMIKKRYDNDSFEDNVRMVGEASGGDLARWLKHCPKNPSHLSEPSYNRLINVMNESVEGNNVFFSLALHKK